MIPPLANFTNHLSLLLGGSKEDFNHCASLKEGIPGWSALPHYLFFRELMVSKPNAKILVCGVYHGLDLRYMAGLAEQLGQKVELVGVDLFFNGENADWPEEFRGKGLTWEQSMHKAPAPNEEAARRNCPSARIYKSDSVEWMKATEEKFDIIYLDAAHDEQSVRGEIEAAKRILKPDGLIAGDDYVWGCSTGGVDKAVQALLPNHAVFFNRIWIAAAP